MIFQLMDKQWASNKTSSGEFTLVMHLVIDFQLNTGPECQANPPRISQLIAECCKVPLVSRGPNLICMYLEAPPLKKAAFKPEKGRL